MLFLNICAIAMEADYTLKYLLVKMEQDLFFFFLEREGMPSHVHIGVRIEPVTLDPQSSALTMEPHGTPGHLASHNRELILQESHNI